MVGILDSEVPYVEMFGIDGMGRGRPGTDTEAYRLTIGRGKMEPVKASSVGGNRAVARRLTGMARRRAAAVVLRVHWDEMVKVFNKERAHLVARERIALGLDEVEGGDGRG